MTYEEAFNKIKKEYLNYDLDPWSISSCFVGILLNKNEDWVRWKSKILSKDQRASIMNMIKKESNNMYDIYIIMYLNNLFLETINQSLEMYSELIDSEYYMNNEFKENIGLKKFHPKYEDALFKAVCVTLKELKKIHIDTGEDVKELTLKKRE